MAGRLAVYEVQVNGYLATLKLTAEEAERLGGRRVDAEPEQPPAKKAPAARNKARTAANKSAD